MFKFGGIFFKNQARCLIHTVMKQNINYIQIARKPSKIFLPQRSASTSIAGPEYKSGNSNEKVTPMGWFLLLVPITTFGLGCWQVKRKAWKEQLIKDLNTFSNLPPVELPDDLSHVKDMEYRVVKVKGNFLHDKELIMGPRSFIRPDGAETAGGLLSQRDFGNGYLVITPFKLSGRDDIVLINRGWIPRKNLKPETRLAGQITDEVELTGIVRKEEHRKMLTPDHTVDLFLYRDLGKMCALTGAQPVFLDASYNTTVPGGPIGGQTRLTVHNDHLSYVITWYGLSLGTAFLWYRNILKMKAA